MDEVRSIGSSLGRSSDSRSSRSRSSHHHYRRRASSGSTNSDATSAAIGSMFIDTKKNMLGIIEDGLNFQLELKSIKHQFLNLIQNFNAYEHQPNHQAMASLPPSTKGGSSARARVRALYEARKARVAARRSSGSADKKPLTPRSLARLVRRERDHDKENIQVPVPAKGSKMEASTPYEKPLSGSSKKQLRSMKPLLTPIKEEVRRLVGSGSCSTSSNNSLAISDIEGEYVTLRTPRRSDVAGDYVSLAARSSGRRQAYHSQLDCNSNETSVWVNSVDNLPKCNGNNTAELSTMDYSGTPERLVPGSQKESPVKYASSDVISELYTSKSLRDISQISRISRTSLREQTSGTNIDGAFHSTFNYPLHSTLNYPLHSTLDISQINTQTPHIPNNSEDTDVRLCDAKTVVSEPSSVRRNKGRSKLHSDSTSLPRTQDDSCMGTTKSHRRSSRHARSLSVSSKPKSELNNNSKPMPAGFKTPTKPKLTGQLCTEHGLHPTFGGPCIFSNDDSFTLTDDSSSAEEHRRNGSMIDTDCDSSYLSEAMEDAHFNQGLSAAEEYTATYDARRGSMKMLRRQTGQTRLSTNNLRAPIGLSESDFLDVTRKHFSMDATRASLPDLSCLSTSSSEADKSEQSTLHASRINESSVKESDGVCTPNSMDETIISMVRRPLSISTTTTNDTSPESNGGLQVPVNSPNVTDKDSGSSSRPTTDTYDYVEIPIPRVAKMQPARLPPRPTTRSVKRRCIVRQTPVGKAHSHQDVRGGAARKCLRYTPDCDSGFSTHSSCRARTQGRHLTISDMAGNKRTVVQHGAVARNLQPDRKKALVKKLKQFNNNFYQSTGNLHTSGIHTLGHF